MRDKYKKQVASLIRIMPSVYRIKEFAVHDKKFLLSFEKGCPNWNLCCAGDLSIYPSVQWKLLNIRKLKEHNIQKYEQGINKLNNFLFSSELPLSL